MIPAIAAKKNNDTPNANIKPSATATECGKPSRMGLLQMGVLTPSKNANRFWRTCNLIEIKNSQRNFSVANLASELGEI